MRLYIGSVFVIAALPKIASPYDFALSVATYQILPLSAVNLFAIVVPWLELSAGMLLIAGFWTRPAALIASALMVMFIVALSIALAKGLDINCGCFASSDAADEIGYRTLFRDFSWLVLSIFLLFFDNGRIGLDGFLQRRLQNV